MIVLTVPNTGDAVHSMKTGLMVIGITLVVGYFFY